MLKPIRCFSTLLLSPLPLLVELKVVSKVGNQTPLSSTDKACELLKRNSEKTVLPQRWCIFLPAQRYNSFWGSPGQCCELGEDATMAGSRMLSTHQNVYCGLVCCWAAYQSFLHTAVQMGAAASKHSEVSAISTSSFHPAMFLIEKWAAQPALFVLCSCSLMQQWLSKATVIIKIVYSL